MFLDYVGRVWWFLLCLALWAAEAVACKKKTVCRPPPGGKPGCGGRR